MQPSHLPAHERIRQNIEEDRTERLTKGPLGGPAKTVRVFNPPIAKSAPIQRESK